MEEASEFGTTLLHETARPQFTKTQALGNCGFTYKETTAKKITVIATSQCTWLNS